ncbi:MAG TPA: hypothetical protein VNH13_05410 [Candidatus Acidoferrales bacterium]|jgi:hypothetical protein|nr:hypothetical protein [Candidatus Acidoferrales bacterium]
MRPSRTVARAALTAALALGSLPGLVGSREPSPETPIDAAAFRQVILATIGDRVPGAISVLDAASGSAGGLTPQSAFVELGPRQASVVDRVSVSVPTIAAAWAWKPPKSTMTGYASFYDYGTTAMRIPRGTVIVICGAAGCIERVVNDYGPAKSTGRIIDMYRPDFFAICGCGWWSGTTTVTIRIY